MSKLSKPSGKTTKQKIQIILKERLPSFAACYFRASRDSMTELSQYAYALDIAMFFEFLQESKGISIKDISIKDFENITEEEIENYIEYSKTAVVNGIERSRSKSALKRRFDVLSSFYTFYYSEGMIDKLPTLRVKRPKPLKNIPVVSSNDDNLALIDYILNGNLPTPYEASRQYCFRERDASIVVLLCFAGLKSSECQNINISDLHLAEGYLYLPKRKYPKVTLTYQIIDIVSRYLEKRLTIIPEYGHENALFLSIQGKRLGVRSIEKMIKKYTTALFGDSVKIVAQNLSSSYKNNIYNATHSVKTTAEMTSSNPSWIQSLYKGDLDEKLSDARNIVATKFI